MSEEEGGGVYNYKYKNKVRNLFLSIFTNNVVHFYVILSTVKAEILDQILRKSVRCQHKTEVGLTQRVLH